MKQTSGDIKCCVLEALVAWLLSMRWIGRKSVLVARLHVQSATRVHRAALERTRHKTTRHGRRRPRKRSWNRMPVFFVAIPWDSSCGLVFPCDRVLVGLKADSSVVSWTPWGSTWSSLWLDNPFPIYAWAGLVSGLLVCQLKQGKWLRVQLLDQASSSVHLCPPQWILGHLTADGSLTVVLVAVRCRIQKDTGLTDTPAVDLRSQRHDTTARSFQRSNKQSHDRWTIKDLSRLLLSLVSLSWGPHVLAVRGLCCRALKRACRLKAEVWHRIQAHFRSRQEWGKRWWYLGEHCWPVSSASSPAWLGKRAEFGTQEWDKHRNSLGRSLTYSWAWRWHKGNMSTLRQAHGQWSTSCIRDIIGICHFTVDKRWSITDTTYTPAL